MDQDEKFLELANEEGKNNPRSPFGGVIVKNGEVVGRGYAQVTEHNDPTAHGEIMAIRDACQKLQTKTLKDCILYTNAKPCLMCFTATAWAEIPKIIYNKTNTDYDTYLSETVDLHELNKQFNRKIEIVELS